MNLINSLTNFFNGNEVETLKIDNPILKDIQYSIDKGVLERVWIFGYGTSQTTRISVFALKKDNVLIIDKTFCTNKEKNLIKQHLQVPFELKRISENYFL